MNKIEHSLNVAVTKLDSKIHHWIEGPGIYTGTFYGAKGLEFDSVIMPFLDSENMPDKDHEKKYGKNASMDHYSKLIYVGITRAKSTLLLLYSGEYLTELLPKKKDLYNMDA